MVSILGIYSLRNLNFQQTTIKSRKNQEAIVTDIWKEVIFFAIAPHYIFGTPCDHKGYELWLIDCNAVTQNCWWPKPHPLIFLYQRIHTNHRNVKFDPWAPKICESTGKSHPCIVYIFQMNCLWWNCYWAETKCRMDECTGKGKT